MTTAEEVEKLVRREVRSPRSAALAGILFSLLIGTSMILLRTGAVVDPTEIDAEWLDAKSSAAAVVLVLIPFAGIAFLWFTGVMRDLLGNLEDKFFLDQDEGRAPLVDHRHLHRGRAVPVIRRCAEMGPVPFPHLGADGEHLHSHLEFPS